MRPELASLLTNLGAREIPHAGGSFYDHLRGCYAIAESRGLERTLRDAAGAHAIYGTEYFRLPRVPSRQTVREIIGSEAERLVWLFCVTPRAAYSNSSRVPTRLGSFEIISDSERQALRLISEINDEDQKSRPFLNTSRYIHMDRPDQLRSEWFFLNSSAEYDCYGDSIDRTFFSQDLSFPIYAGIEFSESEMEALRAHAFSLLSDDRSHRSRVFSGSDKKTVESPSRQSTNLPVESLSLSLLSKMTEIAISLAPVFSQRVSQLTPSGTQLLAYRSDDRFDYHSDNTVKLSERYVTNSPERKFVGILWPNQAVENEDSLFDESSQHVGGNLVFRHIFSSSTGRNLRVSPRPGMLVIMPANAWYSHGVTQVTSGNRFSLTQWWDAR